VAYAWTSKDASILLLTLESCHLAGHPGGSLRRLRVEQDREISSSRPHAWSRTARCRATSDKQLDQLFELSPVQQGYRDLIDSFDDVLLAVSLDGQIRAVNRSFSDLVDSLSSDYGDFDDLSENSGMVKSWWSALAFHGAPPVGGRRPGGLKSNRRFYFDWSFTHDGGDTSGYRTGARCYRRFARRARFPELF